MAFFMPIIIALFLVLCFCSALLRWNEVRYRMKLLVGNCGIMSNASERRLHMPMPSLSPSVMFLLFLLILSTSTEAYDPLDPYGNITITWDVMTWTGDGYMAVVTINNYQQYRPITEPGWTLGWTWPKQEVIWGMVGGQATEQGDCSTFKGGILPHSCERRPAIVDLLPGIPYNQQISNCCKGGLLSAWVQDPVNAVAAFQVAVGQSGNSVETIKLPKNVTFKAPGPGYTCGPAKIVKPTRFLQPDKRRVTQALMTWTVTCTYSQFLAQKTPTCCVSLSAFYNDTIVPCNTCACGCQGNSSQSGNCVDSQAPHLASSPLVQCTSHMCPIRVQWHIKHSYRDYWLVKVAITNFNYGRNYSDWNLVIQHPNFSNLTQNFSFNYASILSPDSSINDTAMFWGVKLYNDFLMQAGPLGNVQSKLLFRKDKSSFSFDNGWAFPRRIYFNGNECRMPPPDSYPRLPNADSRKKLSFLALMAALVALILILLVPRKKFQGCLIKIINRAKWLFGWATGRVKGCLPNLLARRTQNILSRQNQN